MSTRIPAFVLRLSVASCVFLAFGWPFLVTSDPADGAFRVVAVGSLMAFLASLAAVILLKAARRTGELPGRR